MNGYLINFAVYTLAMIGFFVLVIYVYKKAVYSNTTSKNKGFLNVENMLKLSPTKAIYVINAGNEKFLIAGDSANTTMLAKLENNQIVENYENKE